MTAASTIGPPSETTPDSARPRGAAGVALGPRGPWLLIAALAVLDFLVRLPVALRPIEFIDGLVLPDDAYISLTLARNIARGLGPLYGLDPTNGFQPLFVFLMVPFYWIHPVNPESPVHAALVMLSVFDAATLAVLCILAMRIVPSRAAPLFLAAAWIFNPYAIRQSVNGLETAVAVCFSAGSLLALERLLAAEGRRARDRAALLLGLMGGLAALARIDCVLLLLTAGAVLLRRSAGAGRTGDALRPILLAAGIAILVNLPWWGYALHHTGEIFPVSGKAVRHMSLANVDHAPTIANFYLPNLARAGQIIMNGSRIAIAGLIVLLLLGGLLGGRAALLSLTRPLASLLPALVYVVALCLAYSLFIFAPWFFARYLFPGAMLFALGIGIVAGAFWLRFAADPRRWGLLGVVLAFILIGNILPPSLRELYTSRDTIESGYMNVGLWARERFPDGTRIGSSQTGALGYFADNLVVINLDGVVNRACYESLVQKRNIEYIREAGIEYVLGWEVNIAFIRKESRSFRSDDLIPLGRIEDFASWRHSWLLYRVNDRR